jgi:hypothetical protein
MTSPKKASPKKASPKKTSPKKASPKQAKKVKAPKAKKSPKKAGEKKPLSGFFLFSSKFRDAIKKEHPDWKVTEVASELGKRWAALSDSEKASYKA